MKKKIAIPIENGILSEHFGHAKLFSVIQVEDGVIQKEELLVPPPHEPGSLPKWINEIGATDVLAGGLGKKAIQLLLDNNINVFVGVEKKETIELVKDLLNNTLSAGANYCDH